MAVRIVTDSTADIPPQMAEALAITVVPLTVFFGDEAYLDGVELDNAGFYSKLQASKALPTTSQPSPATFEQAYERLIKEGATGILSVHLSSKLSGTYQSACTAAGMLSEDAKKVPIEIVDSESVSVGMSIPIMRAASEAREGHSLAEIAANLRDQLARTRILAVLDTLEYVKRGGRIGAAGALLGNILSFKPIISLKNGEVIALERPRTRNKAYERVAQLLKEMGSLESVVIAEASTEVGQHLSKVLQTVYSGEIPTYKLGAVLGTHTGPGTAAISVMTAKSAN